MITKADIREFLLENDMPDEFATGVASAVFKSVIGFMLFNGKPSDEKMIDILYEAIADVIGKSEGLIVLYENNIDGFADFVEVGIYETAKERFKNIK